METKDKTPAELALRKSGRTYREIGEKIGITAQGVCEVVQGRVRSRTSQYAIALELGMPLREVFPDHPAAGTFAA